MAALRKKTIWFSLGSMMFAMNSMLLLMVVSRLSGIEIAGEFGIAYTVAQLLYIVGLFGVNNYQMTDYVKKYSFGNYFFSKIISSIVMMLSCFVVTVALSYTFQKSLYTVLLTSYIMINSFSEVYQSLFFRENKLVICGQSLFFRSLFSFVSFLSAMLVTSSIVTSLIVMNLTNLVATYFLSVLPARKFVCKADYLDYSRSISVLRECTPIFLSLFLMTFMSGCPKYAIDYYGNNEITGAFNIIFGPAQIINLLSSFIFKPQLGEYVALITERNFDSFYKLFFKQIRLIFELTAVCATFGGWLGPAVFGVIFKADLFAYRAPIVLIIIGSGFLALSSLLYFLLIIFRLQKTILNCYLYCSTACFAICAVMARFFGISGAAFAFILSYALLAGTFLFILTRLLKGFKYA